MKIRKTRIWIFKYKLIRWKQKGFRSKCEICDSCKNNNCLKMKIVNFFGIACFVKPNCYEPIWKSAYDKEPIEKEKP